MPHRYFSAVAGFLAAILVLGPACAAAQQGRTSGATDVQAHMTVSVEARHGMEVAPITRE